MVHRARVAYTTTLSAFVTYLSACVVNFLWRHAFYFPASPPVLLSFLTPCHSSPCPISSNYLFCFLFSLRTALLHCPTFRSPFTSIILTVLHWCCHFPTYGPLSPNLSWHQSLLQALLYFLSQYSLDMIGAEHVNASSNTYHSSPHAARTNRHPHSSTSSNVKILFPCPPQSHNLNSNLMRLHSHWQPMDRFGRSTYPCWLFGLLK